LATVQLPIIILLEISEAVLLSKAVVLLLNSLRQMAQLTLLATELEALQALQL
jgi:hypothetical protein